jgi:hypothetical protein
MRKGKGEEGQDGNDQAPAPKVEEKASEPLI